MSDFGYVTLWNQYNWWWKRQLGLFFPRKNLFIPVYKIILIFHQNRIKKYWNLTIIEVSSLIYKIYIYIYIYFYVSRVRLKPQWYIYIYLLAIFRRLLRLTTCKQQGAGSIPGDACRVAFSFWYLIICAECELPNWSEIDINYFVFLPDKQVCLYRGRASFFETFLPIVIVLTNMTIKWTSVTMKLTSMRMKWTSVPMKSRSTGYRKQERYFSRFL